MPTATRKRRKTTPHERAMRTLSARNQREAWKLYPMAKGAVMDAPPMDPAVDTGRMTATFTISTPNPDRSEDIVHPMGCQLENYAKNPIIYYDHGMSGLSLPIGKSEDDAGNLTVVPSETGIEATAFFSQSLPEAAQIFALIEEKILRTSSIHLDPIDAKVRSKGRSEERPGLDIFTFDLLEWGPVGIPDNAEAVRKVLDRNRLNGEPILESIAKSLTPYAAPIVKYGRGWSPAMTLPEFRKSISKMSDEELAEQKRKKMAEEETAAVTEEEAKRKCADDMAKRKKALEDEEAEMAKRRKALEDEEAKLRSKQEEPPAEEPIEEEATASEPKPYGAELGEATIAGIGQLMAQVEQGAKALENQVMKDAILALVETLAGAMASLEEAYASAYPDHPLSNAEGEEDPDAEAMAKFLSGTAGTRYKGLLSMLAAVGREKGLKPDVQRRVADLHKRFGGVLEQAKKAPAPPPSDDMAKLSAELAAVQSQFAEVTKKLNDALPYRRAVA